MQGGGEKACVGPGSRDTS